MSSADSTCRATRPQTSGSQLVAKPSELIFRTPNRNPAGPPPAPPPPQWHSSSAAIWYRLRWLLRHPTWHFRQYKSATSPARCESARHKGSCCRLPNTRSKHRARDRSEASTRHRRLPCPFGRCHRIPGAIRLEREPLAECSRVRRDTRWPMSRRRPWSVAANASQILGSGSLLATWLSRYSGSLWDGPW